jgi:hypothetical protein
MDQRPSALYLSMKGRLTTAIQHVANRPARYTRQNGETPAAAELMGTDPVDAAIVSALAGNPFSSVHERSRLTCLSTSTVHRHFTDLLRLAVRKLRWISHCLLDSQTAIRVKLSRGRLPVLEAQQARGWRDIVTLDEGHCSQKTISWGNCPPTVAGLLSFSRLEMNCQVRDV